MQPHLSTPATEMSMVRGIGRVLVTWDEHGCLATLRLVDLDHRSVEVPGEVAPIRQSLGEALERWATGEARPFDEIALAPARTTFGQRVRQVLLGIPRGTVLTYGQVAAELGLRGARAVGQSCGANPIPLVVPCHRVVAATGIGGFGLGEDAKRCLLTMEGWRDRQS